MSGAARAVDSVLRSPYLDLIARNAGRLTIRSSSQTTRQTRMSHTSSCMFLSKLFPYSAATMRVYTFDVSRSSSFRIDITFALLSSECTTTTLIDSSSAIYKTTSRLLLSLLACSLPSSRLPFTLTLVLALALRSFQRNRPLLQAAHNLNVPLPLASSKEHQLIRSIRPTRPTLSLDPACIDR